MSHKVFLIAPVLCGLLSGCGESPAQTAREPAADLDIGQYRRTFSETFEHFDVSAWGPGTRWIAHTPWHGDFGDAEFADPRPGFPFATASHILRIEARKDASGHWRSGLIASRDHQGSNDTSLDDKGMEDKGMEDKRGVGGPGFAQAYGYFEIDTKLPPGPGTWPAFWLSGINAKPGAEIDVMEYYGKFPEGYHATVHVWGEGAERFGDEKVVAFTPGIATDQFNRYGVLIDKTWVSFYFNRKQVWRTPTRPEFRQPMYMLADLALGSGWPIDKTPSPSFMYIKSIAAYEKRS